MIIKNLTRKSGSGQLLRYIFRYIMKDEKTAVADPVELERQKYEAAGLRLTYQDAQHLSSESSDYLLLKDFKEKYPDHNYSAYIQNYLMNPEYTVPGWEKKETSIDQPFVLKHNVRSNTISGFIKEFQAVEDRRTFKRSNTVAVHHTIVSWNSLDRKHVTEAMLKDISQEYIRLRGENNLYVCTLHTDRNHLHLHIAMSGTQLNGKASRVSRKEFQDIKIKLQEYQKTNYPNLIHSLPEHGKKERQGIREENIKIQRNDRTTVSNHLLSCLETIQPKSSEHFFSTLKEHGYSPYYRSGKLTGLTGNGYKFRFSRLPVDLTRLEALDKEHLRIQNTLREIAAIRGQSTQTLSQRFYMQQESKEHLQDLEEIRDSAEDTKDNTQSDASQDAEREDEEREIEQDTETDSNEDTEQDIDDSDDTDDK